MLDPEITSTSIRLNWKEAAENYGSVKFFHIHSSQGALRTREKTKLFEGLKPSTTYSFDIAAENEQSIDLQGGGIGTYKTYSYVTLTEG